MRITGLLLKPDLNNLRNDFLSQQKELGDFQYSPDLAEEIRIFLHEGLKEIEELIFVLNHSSVLESAPPKIYTQLFGV